jgi:hypothetical protein
VLNCQQPGARARAPGGLSFGTLNRRKFLKVSAAGAAAAAVGGPLMWTRRSQAATFGEFPTNAMDALLPENVRAKKVLEIFMYGGLSPWETLYMVEEYGRPDDPQYPNQQFHTFVGTNRGSIENALGACAFPSAEPMGVSFAQDALGADVKLGPFAYRLRQRTDLTDRMRILVQEHTLEPHEAAVPQALTGKPVGQPSAAGLGSHVQRFFSETGGAARQSPYSYVFATGGLAGDNVSAAAATGAHPGLARPLLIKIDNAQGFADLLARAEVGSLDARDKYDQLIDVYTEQYQQRLRWNGEGEAVRSRRFTDLSQAVTAIGGVDAVRSVMDQSLFVDRAGSACGDDNNADVPGMSLNAARHLLTHPTEPARYVCVSDIGLYEASGGGGYDTHSQNSFDTARNFDNLMRNLGDIVNAPGENDASKLDLDDTLIILNTEFGRTPYPQDGSTGRNHHPYGYVTALIGGPITSAQRGIFGAIGPNGVASGVAVKPSENRMAALLALGIWPFAPEAFAVSDVRGAADEASGARLVIERALGYSL